MQYTPNEGSPSPGRELFSFATGELPWYTVDDVVMGGVSSSRVEIVEPNTLFFSGNMSLENNGGFSSVRSDWNIVDLSGYDGVLLRVLGDGKIYRLRIRTEETGGDISYNGAFETTSDKWIQVYVPFAKMVPTYRGIVMDVGQLDVSSIGSFGFMLSDKQEGDFKLQVDWIRAVSEAELKASTSK
ncbi:MAG TPA: CIA30 family protein [Anaerolineales bacterium]|nr:CIA30 family protein [Anaerolineales bacterium]